MRPRSIRFRLTLWYSLALAASLILFAAAIWLSAWHSLHKDLERTLDQRMESIESFLRDELSDSAVDLPRELSEYSQAFPDGTYLQVKSGESRSIFTTEPRFPWESASSAAKTARVPWHHHSYRTLTRRMHIGDRDWTVSFAVSLEAVEAFLRKLRLLILALIPPIIILAAAGGAWLSRRALKPVDAITEAARQIGIQNLSERLAVPKTGDELQRLSETWNSMLFRLEDAVSRLSRFTADASHELRTPLSVIRTTAEIASRKSRSAEAYRAALTGIVAESERMTTLIEDLLFLARCDADDLDLPMEPLAVRDVVSEVCSWIAPKALEEHIALKTEFSKEPLMIIGNRTAVFRLILILVDNAVKYCRRGGCVQISVDSADNKVEVVVSDEGPGIPPSELPFVFERFYRGAKARANGNTGFGLGLALASGIAEQHKAKIEVRSSSEEGTSFAVVFPAATPASSVRHKSSVVSN